MTFSEICKLLETPGKMCIRESILLKSGRYINYYESLLINDMIVYRQTTSGGLGSGLCYPSFSNVFDWEAFKVEYMGSSDWIELTQDMIDEHIKNYLRTNNA